MAKNIVIAEGGTAKSFTAKKIQTKAQGSGTVNWIPEDEAVDYVRLVDKKFTAKGIYKPEDFNADGFGTVEVAVSSDVKEKTITANGTFYAADDGCMGYSKVTVAVPGGGGGGPFTVRFFDDDRQTILKTDANVPYGGSASCTALDGTVKNGEYFKGWNPSPTNVRENMNCYPLRGDYVIDPNEIQDNWETICADGGAHYPLGSYKSLVLDIPVTTEDVLAYWHAYDNSNNYLLHRTRAQNNMNTLYTVMCHMVKVAEGEDGSASTWLSTGCINISSQYYIIERSPDEGESWSTTVQWRPFDECFGRAVLEGSGHTYGSANLDWASSRLRSFLNGYFYDNLPTCIKDTIKEVNKSFYGVTNQKLLACSRIQKTSIDKVWIPSVSELDTLLKTYVPSPNGDVHPTVYADLKESSGIDYAGIYVPTYPSAASAGNFLTRTLACTDSYDSYFDWVTPNMSASVFQNYYRRSAVGQCNNNVPFGFCL